MVEPTRDYLFLGGLLEPETGARAGDEVRCAPRRFTTHGVIVGMTGSGMELVKSWLPRTETLVVPDADHALPMQQAELTARAIASFVEQQTG